MLDMLHVLPPYRRLLAAAAFAPVIAAWSLGGCDTGFSHEECQAALAQCGYLWGPAFCRDSPSACTVKVKPFLDAGNAPDIPRNQTVTIDLSSAELNERAVDLWFHLCIASQGSIEDFQIQLDGVDASPEVIFRSDGD